MQGHDRHDAALHGQRRNGVAAVATAGKADSYCKPHLSCQRSSGYAYTNVGAEHGGCMEGATHRWHTDSGAGRNLKPPLFGGSGYCCI